MDVPAEVGDSLRQSPPTHGQGAAALDIFTRSNLAPALIWIMQHAALKNASSTQSSGRTLSTGACSPLPPPSFPLLLSTCHGDGSDVHALIEDLDIRRVEHSSEQSSKKSRHPAEGTEIARLRRRLSFAFTTITSADRGWDLQVARSSGRKTRRLFGHVVLN